ncbi:hypothetical protein B0H11DRAFT_1900577 [Mycena galericulata]|nr:hypothetical protein B0H11DRAFT_1900577 [Mycena galericulata]
MGPEEVERMFKRYNSPTGGVLKQISSKATHEGKQLNVHGENAKTKERERTHIVKCQLPIASPALFEPRLELLICLCLCQSAGPREYTLRKVRHLLTDHAGSLVSFNSCTQHTVRFSKLGKAKLRLVCSKYTADGQWRVRICYPPKNEPREEWFAFAAPSALAGRLLVGCCKVMREGCEISEAGSKVLFGSYVTLPTLSSLFPARDRARNTVGHTEPALRVRHNNRPGILHEPCRASFSRAPATSSATSAIFTQFDIKVTVQDISQAVLFQQEATKGIERDTMCWRRISVRASSASKSHTVFVPTTTNQGKDYQTAYSCFFEAFEVQASATSFAPPVKTREGQGTDGAVPMLTTDEQLDMEDTGALEALQAHAPLQDPSVSYTAVETLRRSCELVFQIRLGGSRGFTSFIHSASSETYLDPAVVRQSRRWQRRPVHGNNDAQHGRNAMRAAVGLVAAGGRAQRLAAEGTQMRAGCGMRRWAVRVEEAMRVGDAAWGTAGVRFLSIPNVSDYMKLARRVARRPIQVHLETPVDLGGALRHSVVFNYRGSRPQRNVLLLILRQRCPVDLGDPARTYGSVEAKAFVPVHLMQHDLTIVERAWNAYSKSSTMDPGGFQESGEKSA